jgi:hypothetical protein
MSEWFLFVMCRLSAEHESPASIVITHESFHSMRAVMQLYLQKARFALPIIETRHRRMDLANEGKNLARNGWRMPVADMARRMFDWPQPVE